MDLIRSGKAPEVIRRKGAEGNLPLPAEDKIEILTLLAAAPEAELREKALDTLQGWDRAEVRRVMASPRTAPDVLRFAAKQLLPEREELREILLWNPSLPAEFHHLLKPKPVPKLAAVAAPAPPTQPPPEPVPLRAVQEAAKEPPSKSEPKPATKLAAEQTDVEILAKVAAGARIEDVVGAPVEVPPEVTKHDDEVTPKDRETLIEKINRMTVVEKIKAALTGNMETRSILIRDSNKTISRAVLESPKISDTEAEGYAAAKNVSEEVLRLIAANRKFMKTYVVVRALVNNPRAPIDVTLRLIARINDRDLKGLSLNRNVPDVIRSMAAKAIKQKEEATKVKLPGKH
ncbi:MAG TPA: hypothetical protein VKO18_16585 [Terriglobia bacterium]|nr:hypothetical protein [Terriglobia bacterium]